MLYCVHAHVTHRAAQRLRRGCGRLRDRSRRSIRLRAGPTMSSKSPEPITKLLEAVDRGDPAARELLWQVVYDELRRMAHKQMQAEARRNTMQTTVLVNEAYLRLVRDGKCSFANRRHFFAAAAKAMRRIRVDDARKRRRLKRNPGRLEPLRADPPDGFTQDPAELLAVNEAVEKLEAIDPAWADIVNLRYYTGLTIAETAQVLGVSPRQVDSKWHFIKAWLHRELSDGDTTTG